MKNLMTLILALGFTLTAKASISGDNKAEAKIKANAIDAYMKVARVDKERTKRLTELRDDLGGRFEGARISVVKLAFGENAESIRGEKIGDSILYKAYKFDGSFTYLVYEQTPESGSGSFGGSPLYSSIVTCDVLATQDWGINTPVELESIKCRVKPSNLAAEAAKE